MSEEINYKTLRTKLRTLHKKISEDLNDNESNISSFHKTLFEAIERHPESKELIEFIVLNQDVNRTELMSIKKAIQEILIDIANLKFDSVDITESHLDKIYDIINKKKWKFDFKTLTIGDYKFFTFVIVSIVVAYDSIFGSQTLINIISNIKGVVK